LYGIKIWTDLSSVLSQSTRVTDRRTDGQTDGQTEFSSQYRVCITCSAVKIEYTNERQFFLEIGTHNTRRSLLICQLTQGKTTKI